MYYLYILQSKIGDHFYIGSSSNINRRLQEHNQEKSFSTKPYRPWVLIYKEEYQERSSAAKREYFLKHPAGYQEKRTLFEKHKKAVER